MKPLPGADEPGETVDDRVAQRIEAAKQRRQANAELRRLLAIRRSHGVRSRHRAKGRLARLLDTTPQVEPAEHQPNTTPAEKGTIDD